MVIFIKKYFLQSKSCKRYLAGDASHRACRCSGLKGEKRNNASLPPHKSITTEN